MVLFTLIAELTRTKPLDWTATFRLNDKNPFGMYVFDKIVQDLFRTRKVEVYSKTLFEYRSESNANKNNRLLSDSVKNFIIIGENTSFSKSDFDDITYLLSQGNNIFIASTNFGFIEKNLGIKCEPYQYFDNNFKQRDKDYKPLRFMSNSDSGKTYYMPIGYSAYFDTDSLKQSCSLLIEADNDVAVLLKNDTYKGSLYLFSFPFTFTNINLLDSNSRLLAEKCLSFLPERNTVIIDYFAVGNMDRSPLKFIMSNKSLMSGYYVLLISVFLFMIFGIKRRQRAIPEIKPHINSTAEFISTIAKLSFAIRDNQEIAQKKINHFYNYIRNKMNININPHVDGFYEYLSSKSGLTELEIKRIFDKMNNINLSSKIDNKQLESLCSEIDTFYKKVNL